MADPGVQFIFLRATRDLLALAEMLGIDEVTDELRGLIARVSEGSNWLWNDNVGGYCARYPHRRVQRRDHQRIDAVFLW